MRKEMAMSEKNQKIEEIFDLTIPQINYLN